ncbi:NACHT domain-containing protein [Curtobacterium sp. ISL-83]|uniref:NACHT domain-containing protein n=1 Tax=Curtobacterium sp. ISL-83 TaxID=2819145 RepID=UPI001BE9BAB1|nr:NACHT domain-containing protein [Curtobacterium sp. ISL-83]MBT2501665.1 NACHT domain-containing protein [Curtobacterium sp. ISL-83]
MSDARRGLRGGAANEAGSLHRAGVAAFFAAAALTGQPVGGLDASSGIPTEVALETDSPTDDIEVVFRDGSKWFVQAKRRGRMGAPLHGTLRQWNEQPLDPVDELVLAAASLSAPLRHTQAVLDSRRGQPVATPSATAEADFERIMHELGTISDSLPGTVLNHGRFFECNTETGGPHRAIASAWLSTIVGSANGERAFDVLIHRMHQAAARQERTAIATWVDALAAAGISPRADYDRTPGERHQALRDGLRSYLFVLAERANKLELESFAPGVPPVEGADLISDWSLGRATEDRDSRTSKPLRLARRQSDLIVVGLPGIGKSTLLTQLAAAWASDARAPAPILVKFEQIASQVTYAEDLTLDLLTRLAASRVNDTDNRAVARALTEMARSGRATFFIDGFDEAFGKLDVVAEGIRRLMPQLHAGTGWVLTSRPDAATRLRRLDIEQTTLSYTGHFDQAITAILGQKADERGLRGQNAEAWVAERSSWLEDLRQKSSDPLLKTPLHLGLLAAYLAEHDEVEPSVDHALPAVLLDRASAWATLSEKRKPPGGWDHELRPLMVKQFIVAVGHLLDRQGAATIEEVVALAVEVLEPWNLSVPVRASIGEQLLWYWDECAAVLDRSRTTVRARYRRWAEICGALWLAEQGDDVLDAAISEALAAPNRLDGLIVAVAQDERVLLALIGHATRATTDLTLAYAAGAVLMRWIDAHPIDASAAGKLLPALIALHGIAPVSGRSGVGRLRTAYLEPLKSEVLIVVASLDLEHRDRLDRDAFLRSATEGEEGRNCAAIAAIHDSAIDGSAALPIEARNIMANVHLPAKEDASRRPKQDPRTGVYNFGGQRRVVANGLGELAAAIVESGCPLSPDEASWLYNAAGYARHGLYSLTQARLARRGFTDPKPPFVGLQAFLGGLHRDSWGWLISLLAEKRRSRTVSAQSWRAVNLGDLLQAMNARALFDPAVAQFETLDEQGFADVYRAIEIFTRAYHLDLRAVEDEARLLLTESMEPFERDFFLLTPRHGALPDLSDLSADERRDLCHLVTSNVDWISDASVQLLLQYEINVELASYAADSAVTSVVAAGNCARITVWTADDPAVRARSLLAGDRAAVRRGAIAATAAWTDPDAASVRLLTDARLDDDWSVRVLAGATQETAEGAEYWSCPDCDHKNDGYEARPCGGCGRSSRPSAQREREKTDQE